LGRDPDRLTGSVDWVLKRSFLRRAAERRPGLSAATLKHLDHLYSSLDPAEGLFWACEREALIDRLLDEERIEWFTANPPEDTRAWTRGRLLGHADAGAIVDVDWDRVVVAGADGRGWPVFRTLHLSDPLRWSRQETEPLFEAASSVGEILDRFEDRHPEAISRFDAPAWCHTNWTH